MTFDEWARKHGLTSGTAEYANTETVWQAAQQAYMLDVLTRQAEGAEERQKAEKERMKRLLM